MTNPLEEAKYTEDGIGRRTILKGAAAGLAGVGLTGTASATEWNELRFQSADSGTFRYQFSVSGNLKRAPNRDGYDKQVDSNTGKGAAGDGGHDDWLFTGKITNLELDGPGKVLVNGKVVADTTNDDRTGDDGGAKHGFKQLRFQSADSGTFRYQFSVSGKLKRAPNRDGYDTQVDSNTGKGAAGDGGHDDWLFTGKITNLELDGPGKVIVDGNVIEDTTKDSDKDKNKIAKVVTVSSPDSEFTNYSFEVTGRLVKLEPNEDSGIAVDRLSQQGGNVRVNGSVGTGDDKFGFTGELIPIDTSGVNLTIRAR